MTPDARIHYIDAWRLLAVAMVVASHIVLSHPWYRAQLGDTAFWYLHELGAFGVRVFFCISGFVICRGLLSEHARTGTISVKNFFIRRALRILPPLFMYILALFLLTLVTSIQVRPDQFARAGLFACNFQGPICGWFLGHTWSLSFEEQFYIFFPFVFLAAANLRKRIALAALAAGLMVASMVALVTRHGPVAEFLIPFCYMLCGCAFASYWGELKPRLDRISVFQWTLSLAVALTIVMCKPLHYLLRHCATVTVLPIALSAIVLATPVRNQFLAAFFLNTRVAYLGKISFSIYLWQQLATADYGFASPWFGIAGLLAVLAISVVSYRYVELPMMERAARITARNLHKRGQSGVAGMRS